MPLSSCLSCGAADVQPILSQGEMPLANQLLRIEYAARGGRFIVPVPTPHVVPHVVTLVSVGGI
jgi:hypothetical protein